MHLSRKSEHSVIFVPYINSFTRGISLCVRTHCSLVTACTGCSSHNNHFPQMLASRMTAYFRKKCVVVTDRRVRLMNEILGCIKFIKMYCWEMVFAQNIQSKTALSYTPSHSSTDSVTIIICSLPVCLSA